MAAKKPAPGADKGADKPTGNLEEAKAELIEKGKKQGKLDARDIAAKNP